MTLTDTACKAAKAKEKPYKLADGGGLYLEIMTTGSKCWRMKYRIHGKEKRLAIGVYPIISLAEAREARDKAKKLLTQGIDPSNAKRDGRKEATRNAQNTFKAVALEWHENQKPRWSQKHAEGVLRKLEMDIFPLIGNRPIADIEAPELLDVLRRIEKRGAIDIAHRARQISGQVFRFGIATGRCKRDHAADLKDALKTQKTTHFAALDIKEIPEFLQKLERNENRLFPRTRRAIMFLMMTFVRPSEMTNAAWSEFDFENNEWHIPAERMKMRRPHIVPLSRQVLDILREQQEETGHLNTPWVFPSNVRPRETMSNGTILVALKRMGYGGRQTAHGFRALAMSTIKEKLGYRHEVVDRQLAHGHRSKVTAAYDRAQFLPERRKMMQEWADYVSALASNGKVIKAKFGRAV